MGDDIEPPPLGRVGQSDPFARPDSKPKRHSEPGGRHRARDHKFLAFSLPKYAK